MEDGAYGVLKKLCDVYKKQSATLGLLLKKLINLCMKEETSMSNHLNDFNTIFI